MNSRLMIRLSRVVVVLVQASCAFSVGARQNIKFSKLKSCCSCRGYTTGCSPSARNFTTRAGNHLNETKGKQLPDVLKSWTKSIIEQPSIGESPSLDKENLLKRPTTGVISKTEEQESSVSPKSGPKFRRRISDNKWTRDKMDDKIIWVDCEMTGLDPSKDLLIEIGVVITDAELNVIATQDSIVFHAEDSVLNGMDPWCTKHHGDSGLTEACKNSKITHEAADVELVKFLQKYTTQGECPMAGNSIGQDRGFIRRQLPKFHSHFHYRDIDVSSIKELARRWFPEAYSGAPRKKRAHRVLDDIRESIEELEFYRSTVFDNPSGVAAKVAACRKQ